VPDRNEIPFVLARGGTSRCCIVEARDLPESQAERDAILLALIGGPDPKQLDGLGGGTQATSKALIVRPADQPDVDIEYTFAQIVVGQPRVDYGGNCGNCLSAVAAYAVDAGYVDPVGPSATVRIWNTNTDQAIIAEVPVDGDRAAVHGDLVIDGVPGSGSPIKLWFVDPGGAVTGSLLPTGNASDVLELDGAAGLSDVEVTVIDAGNLVVFVRAADVGAIGDEEAAQIDADKDLLARLEAIRGTVAVRLGFVDTWEAAATASNSLPKVAFLGSGAPVPAGAPGGRHVTARILAGGKAHGSYAITGGIATAIAVQHPGTIFGSSAGPEPVLTIHHPAGSLQFEVELGAGDPEAPVSKVAVLRTSRRIAQGSFVLG
jgi:2-methylaconitate cis-trans-isomerase PrpF